MCKCVELVSNSEFDSARNAEITFKIVNFVFLNINHVIETFC